MTSRWDPLVEGERAAQARAAIGGVIAALRIPPAAAPAENEDPDQRSIDEISLGRGRAGYALLYDYVTRAGLATDQRDVAMKFLDEAAEGVAELAVSPSLYMGFPGVAWTMQLLHGDAADVDPSSEIDEVLTAYVSRSPWIGDYDLISGLTGVGVYALERLPRRGAAECLGGVVARLAELAERRRTGITWFTRPQLLPPQSRRQHARGFYNVGVAHGVPGVVGFLGACCAADAASDEAFPLLEGAVEWMLSTRLPDGAPSRFPAVVSPNDKPEPARSAWCYGDPGIACALLVAAQATGRADWEREAVETGFAAARRPPETARVEDASLCHGSAGLMHLFNRLYRGTGVDEFRDAALFWFDRTLSFGNSESGVGGFATWSPEDGAMRPYPGFLQGAAGVALALASSLSADEPEWDRVLLASARGRSA
ncbi:MAG: lanthionine synthetase C family protein [Actinomycetota bacterium]|nr:lanthionine synthetase C family protein [Actinomycetota bacterium]